MYQLRTGLSFRLAGELGRVAPGNIYVDIAEYNNKFRAKERQIMSKRVLFIVLVLALLMAACGKKESPASSSTPETLDAGDGPSTLAAPESPDARNRQTTISFAISDGERAQYEGLVEMFEAANPDLYVRLVSLQELSGLSPSPLGGNWPLEAWQALVSGADVIDRMADQGAVEWGLIRDLSPFVHADLTFKPDDFYPSALESAQWDGGTWYLPTELSFRVMAFDKTAFDEAGLAYPEPGWTWNDFDANARALTIREGDQITRWGFVPFSPAHPSFIEGRAGPLIDLTTDPPTPRLDRPKVIEVLQWYVDLYLKEQVAPYVEPPGGNIGLYKDEMAALIEKGQAAMWNPFSPFWPWGDKEDHWGIVPYPVDGPDSKTTPVHVQGLSMSAGTLHPDAAWRWIEYVSRQALETPGLPGSILSARRSVAVAGGFWEGVDEELANALRYALEHSYVQRKTEGYEIAAEAFQAMLAGTKPVQEAAQEAQTQIKAQIQGVAMQQVEATPAPTFVVAADEEQKASEEGTVTIIFTPGLSCDSACREVYRDLAQQFHETHPDVQVEVKMLKLANRIQTIAAKADCFQWMPVIYNPEQQSAVLSLEPFLDADRAFSTDDFYPALLDAFIYQRQLWGLPSHSSPMVIEYNKDLFDAAGVDYPPLHWTTDDFVELALALTQGEGEKKQYGFVPDVLEYDGLLMMLARLGAKFVDEDADPPALSFNHPSTVEALRWYTSLYTEFGVKPVFITGWADFLDDSASFSTEWRKLVYGRRAAMWINSTSQGMPELDGFNTGLATLPIGIENAGNSGRVEGYFISSPATRGSLSTPDTQRACWQWITFLTERPGPPQGLPARRSVAESDAFRQQVGARQAAVYRASLADAEGASSSYIVRSDAWFVHGFVWLGWAHSQVVKGEATVKEALDTAQKLADDYRACVIAKDAFDNLVERGACLKKVDPSLPDFFFGSGESE